MSGGRYAGVEAPSGNGVRLSLERSSAPACTPRSLLAENLSLVI